jgi:hypothetical protein
MDYLNPYNMKQLLVLFSIVFFSSCAITSDNIIHNQKSEKGGWVFDSNVSKPVQQEIEYVQIAPTWGQAFYFAGKRSDRALKLTASIIFLAAFTVLFIGKAKETSWFPKSLQNMFLFNGLMFILIVSAVIFFIGGPSGVKFNNYKWIEKLDYEKTTHLYISFFNCFCAFLCTS